MQKLFTISTLVRRRLYDSLLSFLIGLSLAIGLISYLSAQHSILENAVLLMAGTVLCSLVVYLLYRNFVVANFQKLTPVEVFTLLSISFAGTGLTLSIIPQFGANPTGYFFLGLDIAYLTNWLLWSIGLFLMLVGVYKRQWLDHLPRYPLVALVLISPVIYQILYIRVYKIINSAEADINRFWGQLILDIIVVSLVSIAALISHSKLSINVISSSKAGWFSGLSIVMSLILIYQLWHHLVLYILFIVIVGELAAFIIDHKITRFFNIPWALGLLISSSLLITLVLRATVQANPKPAMISSQFGYDFLFLGTLLAVVMIGLAITPRSLQRYSVSGLGSLCFLIAVGLNFELMYRVSSGTDGNWFWLKFLFINFQDALPYMLAVTPTIGIMLSFSFALVLPIMWGKYSREIADGSTDFVISNSLKKRAAYVMASLIIIGAIMSVVFSRYNTPLRNQHLDAVWSENIFFSIGHDIYTEAVTPTQQDIMAAADYTFDTSQIDFVETAETTRPNIVIIILESVRRASVTPYNPELPTTPFLGQLAEQSMVIEDFNVVVPFSNDSILTLLSGNYSSGEYGSITHRGLPDLLEPLGYESAYFTPYGFDYLQYGQMLRKFGYETLVGYEQLDQSQYGRFGSSDYLMIEPSFEWVDKQVSTQQPFLLTYFTQSCHHPYDDNIPPQFFESEQYRDYDHTNEALNNYLNCLRHLDNVVEEIFSEFDQRKLTDSTIFFIAGDHGELFGEHEEFLHGETVWQEGVQTPALIYAPGYQMAATRVTGPRQQIDLLPTLADLLNVDIKNGTLPGRSLLSAVDKERTLYMRTYSGDRLIVREGDIKYIFDTSNNTTQIFDLSKDPDEQINIVHHFTNQQIEQQRQAILAWYLATGQ